MAKIVIFIIFNILVSHVCTANDSFTLYFVRHAEKVSGHDNPSLTRCGKQRAQQLATLLSASNIKSIYSTHYNRTMSTAAPVSKALDIPITNYSAKSLNQFALHLKQIGENALIVGHSNTSPQLVNLLTSQKLTNLNEDDFKTFYQISFVNNESTLTTFIQPLNCYKT